MDNTTILIVVAVLAIAALAVIVFATMQQKRRMHLRKHFGNEYEQAVADAGSRKQAERELAAREKRVAKFDIRPLDPADRARYMATWTGLQAGFVDDPRAAVRNTDDLIGEIMAERGYPVSDFEQRAADLSVEHPSVVQNYRAGHDITLRHMRGDAGTEDLRQAMIHYRALFEELVGDVHTDPPTVGGPITGSDGRAHLH